MDLSIIIRADLNKVSEYINTLEPILLNNKCELIIINNSADTMDIKYNYTLYQFSGSNDKFKEFCFSSSGGNKIIIIDGNMQLDPLIVDDFILNIENSNFNNTAYKLRKFLSSDKPVYFTSHEVLIYNRGIKGFNVKSNLLIDDFTLTDVNYLETNLNKFIECKCFDELYLWYKHFILKQSYDIKHRFYLLLEFEKTSLEDEDRLYIEELFTKNNEDKDYCEYLYIKNEVFKENSSYISLLSEKINSLPSLDSAPYYSYIMYGIIKDRNELSIIIPAIDIGLLKSIINYLLSLTGFYEYLYDFILKINLHKDIDDIIKPSRANAELIKSYINYASGLEKEPDHKNRLINLFEAYVNIKEKILVPGDNLETVSEDSSEKDLITGYKKALTYFSAGNVNKAADMLWALSTQYPDYEMPLRYFIQKMRYEKNCYKTILSICMIVKDEEKNLDRCLSSIKPLLNSDSELIIVDTGSTDRTVEIAERYSQRVYLYKWQGSFSDARNYSLSLAEGEYIFLLDGDEEIDNVEINKLSDEFKDINYKSYNTFTLKIKNYTDVNLKEYAVITQPRIFRNTPCFYYSGKVHNQPVFILPIKHLPIFITHYGYIMTEDIKDKKFLRTSNMLKLELQKNPQNIYYRFQLSTSYGMHGDLKEALNQAEIYLRKIRTEQLVNDDYIMYYNNAAILYISSHLLKEASGICDEALAVSPKFIDFIYYKALIYYETGELEDALEYTNKYLGLIDNFMDIDIASDGRYSFYTLGLKNDVLRMRILCNHRLGEYMDIINSAESLDFSVYRECLHAIINAYLKTGRYSDVIQLYNSLYTDDNSKIILRYFLEYYIKKLNKREKLLCQSILIALDCFDDKREKLINKTNYRYSPDINESLFIVQNYNIDSLSLNEARELFSSLLTEYNSFDAENSVNISEIVSFKKLGFHILKRSAELRHFKDYSASKQINILRKYMSLSLALIKKRRSDLLDAREQLFLIKITEAFKQIGTGNYDAVIKLLKESVQIYKPMEGIIELIIKNVIPGYHNTFNNIKPVTIIGDNSLNIKSYANVIKEKIAEAANKNNLKDILEIFKQFSNEELYDSELFSYKSVILMSEGLFEDAELEIKQGLLKYPNDIRLLSNLSRLFSLTQRFKESLKIFCRTKMLYKDNCTLELKELIPDSYFSQSSSKLKVLHGTMFGDNTINKIAAELSKKGIYAKTLSYFPKYTGYAPDYVIDMNQYESGNEILQRTLDAASVLIPEFDIFHFHFGSTLTFDYSDLPLLNCLNKKVLVQFYGDEIKIPQNKISSSPIYREKSKAVQEKLAALSEYISHCIVSDEEMYGYVKDFFKEIHFIKENDIDKLIDLYKSLI